MTIKGAYIEDAAGPAARAEHQPGLKGHKRSAPRHEATTDTLGFTGFI